MIDEAALEIDPPRSADPAAHNRLGLVALLYAYRAIAALLIATPAALLAGEVVAGYPRGDAELFDPGGVMLLEASRLLRPALVPLAVQGGLGALVAALIGLLPLAALITALGHDGKLTARFLAARAVAPLGPLALLWGTALLAQVVAVALVLTIGEQLLAQARLELIHEDLARIGVVGVGLAFGLAIGVVHDLARVLAVLEARGFYSASARALYVMRQAPGRALWAYMWRGALALVALSAAGLFSHRVGLATPRALLMVAVSSQAAVVVAVFLRASWLAAAIRLTAAVALEEARSLEAEAAALAPEELRAGEEAVAAVPSVATDAPEEPAPDAIPDATAPVSSPAPPPSEPAPAEPDPNPSAPKE